jgi:TetR/AcrR family transcriptional repressor of lmrAB and yxaGH operons
VPRAPDTSSSVPTRRPTRERIVRAAVHLFQANGFHATGVVEILARAEAPKGSLYHHFPGGKEQLGIAALNWLQGEVTGFLDALAADGAGPFAMVRGLVRHTVQGLRNPERARGSLLAILAQEAAPDSQGIHTALVEYLEAVRRRLIEACDRDGVANSELFADQALALLQGGAVLARISHRPEDLEALVEAWLARFPPEVAGRNSEEG